MSARWVGLGSIVLATGCALVSGLANVEVVDASLGDAPDETSPSDVVISPDVTPLLEAGSGGYALSANGGCASGQTVQLSNLQFTVTLWLRVDALPASDLDVLPILWNGGRGPSEQGWSLDLTRKGVIFCVADQNGFTCTSAYNIALGHLVHIGVVSPYNQQTSGRTMATYAMDRTAGATTHAQVGAASAAQGNWSSSAPFTIGGAQVGVSCTSPSSVTVDRVHVHTELLSVTQLDSTATTNICASAALATDYEFDEGSGLATKGCGATNTGLTWPKDAPIGFVISPFP